MKGYAHPSSFVGMYAVWWRETLVFFREKPRLLSSLISPLLWLVLFGEGVSKSIEIPSMGYLEFLFAGIVVQTFLFSSLFYGAYLVWDRKIDVLKAVLVSPLSRTSIFMGKVLAGVSFALIQSVVLLLYGYVLGIHIPLSFSSLLSLFVIVAFSSAGITALGLTIGSFMESPEGFQLISTFLIFPLFFLSGALYPVSNLSGVLAVIASLNPVTFMVDLVRGALTGVFYVDPFVDVMGVGIFFVLSHVVGVWAFENMRV